MGCKSGRHLGSPYATIVSQKVYCATLIYPARRAKHKGLIIM